MTTERKFCRFNKEDSISLGEPDSSGLTAREVPDGGLCLSSFLVLLGRNRNNAVLMGHLNPDAPWDHLGALDESRVRIFKEGWMLPSSHLILRESPQDAVARIETEQLGLHGLELADPIVASEVYTPKRFPDRADHWDIEFIFKGTLGINEIPNHKAWNELRFIDPEETPKTEIARSHEDILERAGLKLRSE